MFDSCHEEEVSDEEDLFNGEVEIVDLTPFASYDDVEQLQQADFHVRQIIFLCYTLLLYK